MEKFHETNLQKMGVGPGPTKVLNITWHPTIRLQKIESKKLWPIKRNEQKERKNKMATKSYFTKMAVCDHFFLNAYYGPTKILGVNRH